MRWEERTAGECFAAYVQFVEDRAIGGALTPFISKDRIRVWIKDGPPKSAGARQRESAPTPSTRPGRRRIRSR